LFFQRLNLLFFGLETRFHLLGAMSQNLLGFLEIFDLKLLAVELRFFLLQIFLNVLLHVLKYRDLIQIGLLGQLQFFCCLALVFSFFSIHLPFLLQSIFLPFKCFHVSFELSNDLFKLLYFLHLFVFNCLNFIFLLFLLHSEFLFVNHAQAVGFPLARLVSLLHSLQITFELLQQSINCMLVLTCEAHNLCFIRGLHLPLITYQNL